MTAAAGHRATYPAKEPALGWCTDCWMDQRERKAAEVQIEDQSMCTLHAIKAGYTPEEIAAATARTCKASGCEKPIGAKCTSGMCRRCYARKYYRTWHNLPRGKAKPLHIGDTLEFYPNGNPKICTAPGCRIGLGENNTTGLCHKHWLQSVEGSAYYPALTVAVADPQQVTIALPVAQNPRKEENVQEETPEQAAPSVSAGMDGATPQPANTPRTSPSNTAAPTTRTCKVPGCEKPIGEKCTSGLCTRCYARENYRAKHPPALGSRRATQPETVSQMEEPQFRPTLGYAELVEWEKQIQFDAAGPQQVTIALPVAFLDAWWQRLTAEEKAAEFRRFIVEAAGL